MQTILHEAWFMDRNSYFLLHEKGGTTPSIHLHSQRSFKALQVLAEHRIGLHAILQTSQLQVELGRTAPGNR